MYEILNFIFLILIFLLLITILTLFITNNENRCKNENNCNNENNNIENNNNENNNNENNNENKNDEYDTLFHHSSETLTIDGIYSTVQNYKSDFFNINRCYLQDQLIPFQSRFDLNKSPPNKLHVSNYKQHINNKYIEMFYKKMYISATKEKFFLTDEIKYYKNDAYNSMIILPLKRFDDNIKFIFVQMDISFSSYLNDNTYKAIVQLINTLKKDYEDIPYIITGNFNVQGHEKIFKHYYKDSLVCDFYNNCTCNDNNGLASPDGLIVSNKLYKKIEYEVDCFDGYTIRHYCIKAKLYKKGNNETIDVTKNNFKKMIKEYEDVSDNVFINNQGNFDPNIHNVDIYSIEQNYENEYLNDQNKICKRNETYSTMYNKIMNS